MVENLLKVIHILEGLQHSEPLRMLNVNGLQSKISDWQYENQQLIWGLQNLLHPRLWHRILAWNVSWQNLYCDSEKYDKAADGDSNKGLCRVFEHWKRHWENCVRSQGACFRGTEVSFSYVQCFLYLVSSINVFIFQSAWLDTFLDRHHVYNNKGIYLLNISTERFLILYILYIYYFKYLHYIQAHRFAKI